MSSVIAKLSSFLGRSDIGIEHVQTVLSAYNIYPEEIEIIRGDAEELIKISWYVGEQCQKFSVSNEEV